MPKHIALIEDEAAIRENYKAFLESQGYLISCYASRPEALAGLEQQMPDMAVIDIGLQDEIEGGFDLCRELRQKSPQLPILFLTARDSETDAVSGLRLGADDYITKDIGLPHLSARITALFRRLDAMRNPGQAPDCLRRNELELDMDRFHASWQRQPLDLTLTEFWIVHALAQRPGHVKSRDQLMDAAKVYLDQNTVTSHIKRIRKKFTKLDPTFDAIQTMYGAGYRWHTPNGN
ncbi:proteobacterial dedicated sortase system response regulator [Ketobacter sp. MCCC 1A13808]|uniref:proteobacterial dedicated sortase system response regulator n=1 Tax=Ketobacter sp. MCCC 1A13808 TaxID=2602738 RepID=UPI000F12E5E7|nr:proteobacterial dedicated sortase system response regulator [Ketobacter sp. MCCC 1A13808]MVF11784.1 proteobacterial dedicated sortase system response regulator [Ketobacter sp. MCCC 1A13808]RLP55391.1 MAG: proteobacterial dedicated sortase system response regulator [Ketobacter sp.]